MWVVYSGSFCDTFQPDIDTHIIPQTSSVWWSLNPWIRLLFLVILFFTDRTVRLVNGTDSSTGVVEVCVNGTRGYVCSFYWDIYDANVVCTNLGFTRAVGSFIGRLSELSNNEIVLYKPLCEGDEASLFNCPHDVTGHCITGAGGVECSNGKFTPFHHENNNSLCKIIYPYTSVILIPQRHPTKPTQCRLQMKEK